MGKEGSREGEEERKGRVERVRVKVIGNQMKKDDHAGMRELDGVDGDEFDGDEFDGDGV